MPWPRSTEDHGKCRAARRTVGQSTQGTFPTLVSEGVVEAENAAGLLGFDRTREISGKSEREIADAAQAWGRNDDITVVTIQKLRPAKRRGTLENHTSGQQAALRQQR